MDSQDDLDLELDLLPQDDTRERGLSVELEATQQPPETRRRSASSTADTRPRIQFGDTTEHRSASHHSRSGLKPSHRRGSSDITELNTPMATKLGGAHRRHGLTGGAGMGGGGGVGGVGGVGGTSPRHGNQSMQHGMRSLSFRDLGRTVSFKDAIDASRLHAQGQPLTSPTGIVGITGTGLSPLYFFQHYIDLSVPDMLSAIAELPGDLNADVSSDGFVNALTLAAKESDIISPKVPNPNSSSNKFMHMHSPSASTEQQQLDQKDRVSNIASNPSMLRDLYKIVVRVAKTDGMQVACSTDFCFKTSTLKKKTEDTKREILCSK